MSIDIQWSGHASFRIAQEQVIYIDPWKITNTPHDASLILVSHNHYDHYSPADIERLITPQTQLYASTDALSQTPDAQAIKPGETIELPDIRVRAVPAYNPNKKFHPKANNWLGFVVEIGGKNIYYAGDTDLIEEMNSLGPIDLALLPVGGTYTMDADEASQAVDRIKPTRAIPYHWGDIVGNQDDAERFAQQASCEVSILQPGEGIQL